MLKFIRISLELLIYFCLRAFGVYVALNLGVLLVLLFLKFVLHQEHLSVEGHTVICAAIAAYIALFKTKYWVGGSNGEYLGILSSSFGFNPDKFKNTKEN